MGTTELDPNRVQDRAVERSNRVGLASTPEMKARVRTVPAPRWRRAQALRHAYC